ncbi:transmembrane 4 L6 family member 19 [Spea bombifrons]|uniref:transmembrane 4 L6 family member 19 n=1 Tax=Spea bombifrons TaxID=233779 RepID=UPI00234AB235|nr:transmembrane 4 L6 family member 19 [Spea bombifrons]
MCVWKCSRFVGLCLVVLSLLSVTANLLQLFPNLNGSYLRDKKISHQITKMTGVWGGGIMVLLAGIQAVLAGYRVRCLSRCRPCCYMLLSFMFCVLALIGATVSLVFAAAILSTGPYCLYKPSGEDIEKWGYPLKYIDEQLMHNRTGDVRVQIYISRASCYWVYDIFVFLHSSIIYLFEVPIWSSVCIEPPNIIPWTSSLSICTFFINFLEIILCLSQLLNATFGMICGHRELKKEGDV